MKQISLGFILLMISIFANATPVGPINYQGRLLDDNGIPVTGNYNFVVRIYNDPSAGTLKYQEALNGVVVDDGMYSFKIGLGPKTGGDSLWDVALWQGNLNDLFLEIAVNNETLTPRHELTSTPHAFTATLALSAESLGARTAAEYDNILEGVCVGSKGKWLNLAEKCLGAGVSFQNPVHWSELISGSVVDFTNLDLTEADISNVDFGPIQGYAGADLSGSKFNKTIYKLENLDGANLANTQWDAAVSTDVNAFALSASTSITGMTVKNMDMSKWSMSALNSSTASMFSAGYLPGLSSCPAGYPANLDWECREMRAGTGKYFTLGNYHNFTPNSAIAIKLDTGESVLDIAAGSLDNKDVRYSSFSGTTLSSQTFVNTDLFWVKFINSHLKNVNFTDTVLTSADFSGALLENVTYALVIASSPKFIGAKLSHVQFKNAELSNTDFSYASLEEVDFHKLSYKTTFSNVSLDGVRVHTSWGGAGNASFDVILDNSRIYGDFYVKTSSAGMTNRTFTNVSFLGGTWSGDFSTGANAITFAGTLEFKNVLFQNLNLTSVVFPGGVDGTGITYGNNVTCPNGIVRPNVGHNCP